jgi:3-oxoacyl-[acyl-carrier-protein] synthase II
VKAWRWWKPSAEARHKSDGEIMTAARDKFGRPIVVVTGMGVVTSLGSGKADNWAKLCAGESGIRTITRFPTDGLKTTMAGTVDFIPVEPFSSTDLSERLADIATEEAVAQAAIGSKGNFPGPLFLAVAPVEVEWPQRQELARATGSNTEINYDTMLRVSGGGRFTAYHRRFLFGSVADHLADTYGTKGSPISLSTACASGATAIQLGVEAIRRGEADAALCVATDGSVNPEALIRFSLLSALSTHNEPPQTAVKPFAKNRDGFVMAEGAGALVLESMEAATARGATILGIVAGCGELADSFHRTRSSPDGKPIIGCVRNALSDAGIVANQIDYINAHGTGTLMNDITETRAIRAVFGGHADRLAVSSTKSLHGHCLGAAGAIELAATILAMRGGFIPPTANFTGADPQCDLDYVVNETRNAPIQLALSNSFAFGGLNAVLAIHA